jgi:hypothetical protein
MHNLHLVVVKDETPEDACRQVESFIEDFGNENNWRCIGGCVSEDNEVYNHDSYSRWKPSDSAYNTIEKLNKQVSSWIKPVDCYYKDVADKVNGGTKLEDLNSSELYRLTKYIEHQYQVKDLGKEGFNILEDEFYPYAYDECGVTQCDWMDGAKTYVVFVDMHS